MTDFDPLSSAQNTLQNRIPSSSHRHWPLIAGSLLIAGFALWSEIDASARTVLRGGTTITDYGAATPYDAPAVYGRAYHPQQANIRQADRLVEDYKLQAAEDLYRQALKQNPKNPGALNGLGKVAYYKTTSSNQNSRSRTGEFYEEAINRFMSALRYQPGYVEAHINLAQIYMEQHRMGDAADELYRALHLAPRNDEALARQGEWLVRNNRSDEAIPYLKKAIRLNSANVTAHYYLGMAQVERNEMDEALQNFNTTLWLQPRNGNAHYQMGRIYEGQGNAAGAVEHYRQALLYKPELAEARLKLADLYQNRADNPAALEQLKTTLGSTEPTWELTDRTAKLSMENEQPDQAVKLYRAWLNAHPEDSGKANPALSKAKTRLAVQKLRDRDLISQGEAHRYAEQALKAQPNNFEARMIKVKLDQEMGPVSTLTGKEPGVIDAALSQPDYQPYQSYEKGELLLARYQFRKAEQAFRTARRTGEGKRSPMHFGELFLAKGLPTLAEESFQQVLAQAPGNASARLGLAKAKEAREQSRILLDEARLEHRKESLPTAILLLKRSLQANAENSQAYYLLGQIYEKRDDYATSADHYYAYLQLEPMAENADGIRRKIEQLKRKAREQRETGTR
jgi:tetratricopeptide (TPR) repeat protein